MGCFVVVIVVYNILHKTYYLAVKNVFNLMNISDGNDCIYIYMYILEIFRSLIPSANFKNIRYRLLKYRGIIVAFQAKTSTTNNNEIFL